MSIRFKSYKPERVAEHKQHKARALEAVGGTGERFVKERIDQNGSVRSSRLIGSIAHEPRGEDTVAVGTGVEYAPFVELGHHHQPGRYDPAIDTRLKRDWVPPKPFMRPGIEEQTEEFRSIIEQEMKM